MPSSSLFPLRVTFAENLARYHPDKNTETNTTAQFQEVGSAWNICQRHYEQPELSQDNPFPSYGGGGSFYPPGAGVYFNGGSFSFFSAAPPGYHGGYSDEDDEDYEEEFYRYVAFCIHIASITERKPDTCSKVYCAEGTRMHLVRSIENSILVTTTLLNNLARRRSPKIDRRRRKKNMNSV